MAGALSSTATGVRSDPVARDDCHGRDQHHADFWR